MVPPGSGGPAAPPLPDSLGAGRYRVERFLGEGSRKRVYLARDTRLDSDVAVAVVKTEGLDADGLARVKREAQAMGRLRDHAYIVPVFDIGQEGAQPFIVSQYMEGGSIEDRLRAQEGHKLPIPEALRVAEQVALALEHAHGLEIVHRDLKPANVWVGADGTAKLGDFGLAVALDRSRITQEGMLVGTVAYMPPEQAMGRTPDARSDLYALGAMLYEMVTGRPPFLGDDAVTVISQHVSSPPVAPTWHNPAVPPALERLIQQLLDKDPGKRPQTAAAVAEALRGVEAAPAEAAAPPAPTGRAADTRPRAAWGRFVGRREELDELKEALQDALGGRGSLAMLVGEPGIGKTRLAEEFTVYARLSGAQVLTGRSYEGGVDVSYFPFVEAFRQYVRARPDEELRSELGPGAPDVANLVSEIRQRFPDLPESPRLEGDAERLRLFDSVAQFLRNAAAAGPIVLHLDDLHWSDKPSLLLLRYLVRSLAGERVLFLGAYRDVELDRTHPLAEVLGTLRQESPFRRVLLRGLPTDDVVAYLSAVADDVPDAETMAARRGLAEALSLETEGNPFFIGEVLTHLVESGKLVWDGSRWAANVTSVSELGIPEGVREVVGRRLSSVSPVCNDMLTVASAMPAGFGWDLVQATVEADEAALLDALDEALAARLIREREGGHAAVYEFTHALIRQTLYEELSAPRRVLLHRRIGERLEALHGDAPGPYLPELAHHFFQAAPGGDVTKAVGYAIAAGERAAGLSAYEEAAGHFDRALQALDLRGEEDPATRCDVLLRLAEVHGKVGALEGARDTAGRASELARSLGDAELLARAALAYGIEHRLDIDPDEDRVARLEDALGALEGRDTPLTVRVMRGLCNVLALTDSPRGRAYGERALALARRIGDPVALCYGLSARHITLSIAEHQERCELARELLEKATEARLPEYQALALQSLLLDLLEEGDAAGARSASDRYAAMALETREPHPVWFSAVFSAMWAILEGRFEEAERLADEALALATRFEHPLGPMFHTIQISRVRAEQGRIEEMVPALEAVLEQTSIVGWRTRLIQLYAELGREDDARREFELLAADDFAGIPDDNVWLLSVCYMAEACALLRDSERAETLTGILLPHASRNVVVGNAAVNGSVARYLGLLAAVLGRYDDAVGHFESAIDLDRRLGARPLLARVQVDYARMLLERGAEGDREHALQLANDALTTAQELGMQRVTERSLATKLEAQGVDTTDTQQSVYAVATIVQSERPDLTSHAAADGTVTLMFSDMEGFTHMTESLGDLAAHQVVQEHNRVVREQAAAHGGREIELRGDGFLLAFPSARQAALCAISLQRAFAARDGAKQSIRVRIGLHTGEAIADADKFFGKTVIQAFRIADLAKGQEILTSSLTAELLGNAGDLRLEGGHEVELKGLEGRHRVFALAWS